MLVRGVKIVLLVSSVDWIHIVGSQFKEFFEDPDSRDIFEVNDRGMQGQISL